MEMPTDIYVGCVHSQALQLTKKKYGKIMIPVLIMTGIALGILFLFTLSMIPFQHQIDASMDSHLEYLDVDMQDIGSILDFYSILFREPLLIVNIVVLLLACAYAPLDGGRRRYMLNLSRGHQPKASQLFKTYRKPWRYAGCFLWVNLWLYLWSMLFIVPGIIKKCAYFMTPYLVAEYENLTVREAMNISKRITKGYKWQIFLMYLILLGWEMLSAVLILTMCLAFLTSLYPVLWLMPLTFSFEAKMYSCIKEVAFVKGTLTTEDLKIFVNEKTKREM